MNRSVFSYARKMTLALAFLPVLAGTKGQTRDGATTIAGKVCDAENQPLASATVVLEPVPSGQPVSINTDGEGHFRFSKIAVGTYRLRVKRSDFLEAVEGPFSTGEKENPFFVVHLEKAKSDSSGGNAAVDIPFSNETNFTVAGVTDTTSLGGHGSDPVRRNSDALSRDAAKLTNSGDATASTADETRLREQLTERDDANVRFQLAEIEEKSGHALEAVKNYQRAAEMAPTEPHLFAWGAELLLHRAFDPSIEIFTKGRRLYPKSVRMILGLGSAIYASGSAEQAMPIFLDASDVEPSNETPYLFLGRVQKTEKALPAGWTARLKRFADSYPDSAIAHYFYAVALLKGDASDSAIVAQAESQLRDAIRLDPHLGDAYLELGIVAAQGGDTANAITHFKQAIANTPLPDDAHYRLAQVYRGMGEMNKAREESELYREINEKKRRQVELERHELQQFVYTLREQAPRGTIAPK